MKKEIKRTYSCHAGYSHEVGCPHKEWPQKIEELYGIFLQNGNGLVLSESGAEKLLDKLNELIREHNKTLTP